MYTLAIYEKDVPNDYVPFRILEIGNNHFENVRFLVEDGKDHPFLIGRGEPYPKIWISAKNDKQNWQRVVFGDCGLKNIGVTAETMNIREKPEDQPQYGVKIYAHNKPVLLVRATGEDTAVIDHIDLRPFRQPIWLDNGVLHFENEELSNEEICNLRVFLKCGTDVVGLETPYSGIGRPSMPADVELYLRQEAGFGCCRCGHAIVAYHHIVPWEEKQHFDPDHMMAVCPSCHEEMKVMSREDQYELKRNPFNVQRGFLDGQLVAPRSTKQIVTLGRTARFVDCVGPIITIDNTPILNVRFDEYRRALISLNLFDENDNLIATIIDNQWRAGAFASWDFECRPGYLKIRNKPNSILLEFDLKDDVLSFKGMFWKSGNNIWVKPSKILMRRGTTTRVDAAYLSFVRSVGFRVVRARNGWAFGIGPMWF